MWHKINRQELRPATAATMHGPRGSVLQLRSILYSSPATALLLDNPKQENLTQLPIMLNKVHLGEEVDVWQLHMQHGGQRGT